MKDRPILFSGPMVRALLAGTKTQTRRVVKPQPDRVCPVLHLPRVLDKTGTMFDVQKSPYGQPGDRLWVRETWAVPHRYDGHGPSNIPVHDVRVHYAASEERGGLLWRPSIHMPRWASRITLEINAVRVERLQDISEADAKAEGLYQDTAGRWTTYSASEQAREHLSPVEAYRDLWEQINGPGSWDANPWVWVVEFRRTENEHQ